MTKEFDPISVRYEPDDQRYFWDVDLLKEKTRLHSQTVWYAGRLYGVYDQLVWKKGIQLCSHLL